MASMHKSFQGWKVLTRKLISRMERSYLRHQLVNLIGSLLVALVKRRRAEDQPLGCCFLQASRHIKNRVLLVKSDDGHTELEGSELGSGDLSAVCVVDPEGELVTGREALFEEAVCESTSVSLGVMGFLHRFLGRSSFVFENGIGRGPSSRFWQLRILVGRGWWIRGILSRRIFD